MSLGVWVSLRWPALLAEVSPDLHAESVELWRGCAPSEPASCGGCMWSTLGLAASFSLMFGCLLCYFHTACYVVLALFVSRMRACVWVWVWVCSVLPLPQHSAVLW